MQKLAFKYKAQNLTKLVTRLLIFFILVLSLYLYVFYASTTFTYYFYNSFSNLFFIAQYIYYYFLYLSKGFRLTR